MNELTESDFSNDAEGKDFKIRTSNQMPSRLPIILAQFKSRKEFKKT